MRNRLIVACLWLTACSSACSSGGGPGSSGTSSGGSTGQAGGTTGAAGSSTAGTTGTAGASAGQAGRGGSAAGAAGQAGTGSGGTGGGSGGVTGQAGNPGSAGTSASGNAGSGMAGSAAGRGGTGGGVAGTAGGGRGGNAGTSAGGSTGSGGTGGGASGPVTPTKNGTKYRFAYGDVVLEVDSAVGARVSVLSLAGTNLIMPAATDPTTWGSVFWTSPRSDWTPVTWPPPVMIDSAAYTGGITGNHVVLDGPMDTSIGVRMSKDYAADASGWITIAYTIHATGARKAAPWEISRVPRGGIVFFPVPSGATVTRGPLTITQSNGIVWFDDAPKTATSPDGDKLYTDGAGWTAYVLNGNLFLKRYADQPASAQAPMEGEIDVYPGAGFLEFEVEGPYTQIAAWGALPWSIQWRVVKVPASISVTVGSTALVDFAKQQIAM